ncbi:hypothetical protein FEM48_Zijuj04G0001800 [Ziziphus jujuba var. spinosa]|uniref:Uncharacterized protein n=1 Tax=Ziziphus jujuba var. spinosa TaxID=714518 RepID=A0A978VGP9_ZIZJJ|nr:hypothetical protein FEM48_Zijuj04G0001800 [Ziziphus jujuba var. spinosa]
MNHIRDPMLTSDYHVQLLSKVFLSEEDAKQAMVYSYKHSFSGFSAMLDSTQASALASIWPESRSFREDGGMKPIPWSWKGRCCKGEMFEPEKACNRKLIGARYYLEGFERRYGPLNRSGNPEYRSARDFLGHGTHTASTAVGSVVDEAISFMGSLGKGIARGGAPRARLAVYKACWGKDYESICNEADVIAAFDDALYDGVHVISASIGVTPPLRPFFNSSTAIGSFHAAQLGVSVVFSAGNDGSDPGLVTNVAPWSISVAASSIDRMFSTSIILPDTNLSFLGESFITSPIKAKLADAYPYFFNSICRASNRRNVSKTAEGKVIICFSTAGQVNVEEAEEAARNASALALIFVEPTVKLTLVDTIPTLHLNIQQGTLLRNFLVSSRKPPLVHIEASKTIIGKSPAPTVAFFSSRGPSSLAPDILKSIVTVHIIKFNYIYIYILTSP